MRERGQATQLGVGGLIALLILIAIGALVLYEVTGALGINTAPSTTLTLTNDNSTSTSATLTIEQTISSATLASSFTSENDLTGITLTVQLNDDNIVQVTADNVSAENVVTDYVQEGTNTITVVNTGGENGYWTGTATLDINTYAGTAVGDVEEKGATVLGLLTILAIVVVAALIIGVVMRAIGGVAGVGAAPPPALFTRRA